MNKQFNKEKIEKHFQEVGIDITCHGESTQGRIVISRKFKNPEIEKQKSELIEEGIKGNRKQFDEYGNNLHRHFVDSGDSLTYYVETKNKDRTIKESYIEGNQKKQEQELEEKTNQQNQLQEIENKDNNSGNIYYGIGFLVSLILLIISVVVVWVKKKR